MLVFVNFVFLNEIAVMFSAVQLHRKRYYRLMCMMKRMTNRLWYFNIRNKSAVMQNEFCKRPLTKTKPNHSPDANSNLNCNSQTIKLASF